MGDRKYRTRGYMDSARGEREKRPAQRPETFGPKTPKLPGAHSLLRCASCATVLTLEITPGSRCPRCGAELHSCKQCAHLDTSSRFECTQPISERVPRKDAGNQCTFFAPRTTVERETSTSRPLDARQAFENLFKK